MTDKNQDIDWKELYDMMIDKYQALELSFVEQDRALNRIKKEETTKGKKNILQEILILFDNIEKLNEAAENNRDKQVLIDAVKLIFRSFQEFLSKVKVEHITAEPCTQFNPQFHDAFSVLASDTIEKDFIIEVTRKGYLFEGKLLRPARVVVSSGKA